MDTVLKEVFGYDSFRPLQREIIDSVLAGRDTFALLPTGGGKSLCFQLPALTRPGLTLVVSPLIALMKDQVDALQAAGVEATYLNSTLKAAESRERMNGLHEKKYKLLYAAPERLLMEHWEDLLQSWDISLIAIDEAHCISEWGHDFRPEYRKLERLRKLLPDIPVLALTATATDRVRSDIIRRLHLKEPACFTASFNRPNLTYRVVPKQGPTEQVWDFIRKRSHEAGIVYCATRDGTEDLADSLRRRGHPALSYHAGLSDQERSAHQDAFLRDEAKTICATIAFGMGINKPNVRYVIHHDLPKNLESYYQETGRAGRDGLPSDCLLLFSAGDAAKQRYFIDQMSNPEEQQHARHQLNLMIGYAESAACRRLDLLAHFGETWTDIPCQACDNCLTPRETYDGTVPAQKFLSCVYRIKQSGGYGAGMNHVVEVLTGAQTEKIRQRRHDQLTTYGIGADIPRKEWQFIGRELLRLGYLRQTTDKYSVLELTPKAVESLRDKSAIHLSKPITTPAKRTSPRRGEIECDEALFEILRTLRQKLAKERGVPAYIIFGDNSLRQMARDYPTDAHDFAGISGVGEKKAEEFTAVFTATINGYLQTHPKVHFH